MIVYRKSAGRAHDVRLVPQGYVAEQGEILIAGDVLPDIATLDDPPPAWLAFKQQMEALEGAPLFLSRPVREFILAQILYNHLAAVHGVAEPMTASDALKAQGIVELSTPGGQYFNRGFANMKVLDDQVKQVRGQYKAAGGP